MSSARRASVGGAAEVVSEYEAAFGQPGGLDGAAAAELATGTGLRRSALRGLYWRVFLGALGRDPAAWADELRASRAEYEGHRERFIISPSHDDDGGGDGVDLAVNNPLSTAEDSPWSRFFQDSELSQQIKIDLERTHPEVDHFARPEVRKLLLNVLFVWAKLHPGVSYRQGMNELAAPVALALSRDAAHWEASGGPALQPPPPGPLAAVFDGEYLEHDVFAVFSLIMGEMREFFAVSNGGAGGAGAGARGAGGGGIGQLFDQDADDGAADDRATPVVKRCRHIHHVLLAKVDPSLYRHLESVQVLPQLYALRWIRLLFAREFHLEDVMRLWDALFAHRKERKGFFLLNYMCVAMLRYVRQQLLDGDNSFCLRRLLKYPPVEDVGVLLESALRLVSPSRRPAGPAPAGARQPQAPQRQPRQQQQQPRQQPRQPPRQPQQQAARRQPQQPQQPQQHQQQGGILSRLSQTVAGVLSPAGGATQAPPPPPPHQRQHTQQQQPASAGYYAPPLKEMQRVLRDSAGQLDRLIGGAQLLVADNAVTTDAMRKLVAELTAVRNQMMKGAAPGAGVAPGDARPRPRVDAPAAHPLAAPSTPVRAGGGKAGAPEPRRSPSAADVLDDLDAL